MQWELVVALVVATPLVLFPVALVWYLNASGLFQVIRDTRQRAKRLAVHKEELLLATEKQPALIRRIREVQVFRTPGEEGITDAVGRKEEAGQEERARTI